MNIATKNNQLLINPQLNCTMNTQKMFEKKDCCLEIPYDCVSVDHFFSDLEDVIIAHYENLPSPHSPTGLS
jgi:hypothetical protein